MPADRDAAAIDGWHELAVANPTFLLERLGSECTDPQGLRELTVNGLGVIAALGDLVCFKRHPDGRRGLEPQRWPDGRSDFWRPLGEQEKPWLLRGQDQGTQVVLLGRHGRHDTIQPPDSVTEGRRRWIARYLNGRFLRLPEQVEVLVRDQQGQPRELQRIHGEQHHLHQRAIAAGVVPLSVAIARWWVLDDHRVRRREAAIWASTGHVAAVFGDELYDILPQTRGGYGRLQDFGIRFGYERVVLHLEPRVQADRLQCNAARTLPLLDHELLPWARWGEEFAAAMPTEIQRLQQRSASADAVPRQEAIRQRVTAIMPLYRLSPPQAHDLARYASSPRPTSAASRPTRPSSRPLRHAEGRLPM